MKRISNLPLLVILAFIISNTTPKAFAILGCEANFVRYINGDLPADLSKNPLINMWDERFDVLKTVKVLSKKSKKDIREYIAELTKLVHKDATYNDNLAMITTILYKEKKIDLDFVENFFIYKKFEHTSFYFSKSRQEVLSQVDLDPEKVEAVKKIVKSYGFNEYFDDEYTKILIQSNRSSEEIEFAFEHGMKLNSNKEDLIQFKRYIEFIDNSKPQKVKKALLKINEIYDYRKRRNILPFNPLLKPHKEFLAQMSKLNNFEARRVKEIERGLKLQQKNGVIEEIDEVIQKEANSKIVKLQEKLRLQKKIDDMEIPHSLKQRAIHQAKHEKSIYRKLLNGCNRGSSQRISSAKKKFSRFKFALSLGVLPTMYIIKNKDKIHTDEQFWEKLGHELVLSLMFTYIGNKIVTNTSTSFFKKYLEGYVKFGVIGFADSWSYDQLFGDKSLIRHIQKFYKDDVSNSKIEKEYKKLIESPTFEDDVKKLLAFLEEKSKSNNTKNFLDKYFNLSTYSSLDDEYKITQQDLESEEAQEVLMELLAEKIYLQNMGNWPIFQTGNKGNDRYLFYRARASVLDIKGLMVNLAIFELMCREPFGKVGSWAAVLGIVIGDNLINGDITYKYRREAINQ